MCELQFMSVCVCVTFVPSFPPSPPLLFPALLFSEQSAHSSLGCAFLVDMPGRNLFRSVLVNDLPQKALLSHPSFFLLTYFLKTGEGQPQREKADRQEQEWTDVRRRKGDEWRKICFYSSLCSNLDTTKYSVYIM